MTMGRSLILRRIAAFLVDYLVIIGYALAVLGITLTVGPPALGPVSGQFVGFATLTLPVFLYFFLTERGPRRATLGKRVMHLRVEAAAEGTRGNILLRNVLKLLPWEVAHAGVHWVRHFGDEAPPTWVWVLLVAPQLIMLTYLIGMAASGGARAPYDRLAGTSIVRSP